ncbi:MAG: hypothetical protein LBT97_10160, partial [Planctomycetota bacterium]|nr:hypothetical protein [Planctomycetota bacterium]
RGAGFRFGKSRRALAFPTKPCCTDSNDWGSLMSHEMDVLLETEENEESSGKLGEMKELAEKHRRLQHWIAFGCGIAFSCFERRGS